MVVTVILQLVLVICVIIGSKKIIGGWGWRYEDFSFGYELAIITLFHSILPFIEFIQECKVNQFKLNQINIIGEKMGYIGFAMVALIIQSFIFKDIKKTENIKTKQIVAIYSNSMGIIIYVLMLLLVKK